MRNLVVSFLVILAHGSSPSSLPGDSVFVPLDDVELVTADDWYVSEISSPFIDVESQTELEKLIRQHASSLRDHLGLERVAPVPYLWGIRQERIPRRLYRPSETRVSGKPNLIRIHLEAALYVSATTGVYSIREMRGKVIKYHVFCAGSDFDSIDPTAVEAFFMEKLGPVGISPKVYYYSRPLIGTFSYVGHLPKTTEVKCPNPRVHPRTRFIIMERVGLSLYKYMAARPGGRVPIMEAMKMGIAMIELVQELHEENVVHADLHLGNFAFAITRDGEKRRLRLIDFGRSKIIGKRDKSRPVCTSSAVVKAHPYWTKWAMRNCKPSFRDDVYLTVQMVAMLMYGQFHFAYLEESARIDLPGYITMRDRADFFEFTRGITKKMTLESLGVSRDDALLVRDRLAILSHEVSVDFADHPHAKPRYGVIVKQFQAIVRILSGPVEEVIYDL